MCGIAGFFEFEAGGSAEDCRRLLEPMLAAMAHRGPDGRGTWAGPGVGLGHLRLAILDPSAAAHQPIESPSGASTLAYNGEVYNYRDLRGTLEREGVAFRSHGDTEVVLQALEQWGPERALPRFNGMFALAWFDRRSRTLWLARDRMGIKPLYVQRLPGAVAFASEARALLARPGAEMRPNVHTLLSILVAGPLHDTRTPFCGIESLEPGTWLVCNETGERETRWYDPIAAVLPDVLSAWERKPEAEWCDAIKARLAASVELHMASDAPMATTCSGGVDSGLVTALAHEHRPDLVAYVADQVGELAEGAAATEMARHLGLPLRTVTVDRERFLRELPTAIQSCELATPLSPGVARRLVAREAANDGFKVLLTGEGADELFGGYDYYAQTLELWRRPVQRKHLRPGGRRRARRKLEALGRHPFDNQRGRSEPALASRLENAIDAGERNRARNALAAYASVESLPERAYLAQGLFDLGSNLRRLLHAHDTMGMSVSIEMRVPFVENELLDLALHLPFAAKWQRGIGKWALKQTALERLPRSLVLRPKRGFPTPPSFFAGLTALLPGGHVAAWMQWPRRLAQQLAAAIETDSSERLAWVSMEIWARLYVDREDPQELGERLVEQFRPSS